MNYRANIAAVFRRACACPRQLTAGALACTISILLSTAVASPALARPGGAHLARVTRDATPTVVRQASARAAEDRRICAQAAGDAAINACTDAIASGQHEGKALGEIYYNRAVEYGNKGDDQRALADYSEAIRLSPTNASAYYNRGTVFAHRGENGRALADFDEAIRLAPNHAAAFSNRGLVWSRQGDDERAITDFSKAIRLAPDRAAPYYNRGRAWYRLKDYARAVADLNEAARLDPADVDTLYARGLARRANGDLAGGETDITAAKRIDPNVAPSRNTSR